MQSYSSLATIPLDDLANKVGGHFKLTYLVSQRLRQINAGSPLMVVPQDNEATLAAVCREIQEDKISMELPEEKSVEQEGDFTDGFDFEDDGGGDDAGGDF